MKKILAALLTVTTCLSFSTWGVASPTLKGSTVSFYPVIAGYERFFRETKERFEQLHNPRSENLQSVATSASLKKAYSQTKTAPSASSHTQEIQIIQLDRQEASNLSRSIKVDTPTQTRISSDFINNVVTTPVLFSSIQIQRIFYSLTDSINIMQLAPNDTYYSAQWALAALNMESAWDFTRGAGITVAVIDSGIQYTHEDIAANIWSNPGEIAGNGLDDDHNGYVDDIRGWNFRSNNSDISDTDGHGTATAGTIGAVNNNNKGISGVAPGVKIMGLRAFNANDTFNDLYTVVEAMISSVRYAVDMGARVISISLGFISDFFAGNQLTRFQDSISYARSRGAIVVAAGGNGGQAMDLYPALFNDTIAVGALYKSPLDGSILRDSYSNYGNDLDFMAPGTNILVLRMAGSDYAYYNGNSNYTQQSGTSFATPIVAGAAALLLAQNPLQTFDDIYRRLKFSSTDKGASGFDTENGWGMINPFKALSEDYYSNGNIKTRFLSAADFYGIIRKDYDTGGNLSNQYDASGNRGVFDYYPGTGKVQRVTFYNPQNVVLLTNEYYADGVSIYRRLYPDGHILEYALAGWLQKENFSNGDIRWYFVSGNNQKFSELLSGKIYEYLDENFYGNDAQGHGRGRKTKEVTTANLEFRYTEYWPGTDKVKTKEIYQGGVLQKTQRFASNGTTLISETSPSGLETRFIEYWPGTDKIKKTEIYQSGSLQKTLGYYLDGNLQSSLSASSGTLEEYLDENYYPTSTIDFSVVKDSSTANHALTLSGDTKIDLTNQRVGSANSLPIRLDGNTDYIQASDSPDWDFGTGNFTWETWIKFSSTSGDIELFSRSDNEWSLQKTNGGTLRLQLGGPVVKTEPWSPQTGVWYHLAIERSSGSIYFYVNGSALGSGSPSNASISGSDPIQIGATHTGARSLNGWVDGFRVSTGVARYTGNFTPPIDLIADAQSSLALAPAIVPTSAAQGRKTRELFPDGHEFRYLEYWTGTDKVKTKEIYQNGVLQKTQNLAADGVTVISEALPSVYTYFPSGNRKSLYDGVTHTTSYYLDENFYGNDGQGHGRGRKSREVADTGLEMRYTEYWTGTDKVKTKEIYQGGILQKTQSFLSDGVTLSSETNLFGDHYEFFTTGNRKSFYEAASHVTYEYYDENFYGNDADGHGRGRVLQVTQPNGGTLQYNDYWPGTDKVKQATLAPNTPDAHHYEYYFTGNEFRHTPPSGEITERLDENFYGNDSMGHGRGRASKVIGTDGFEDRYIDYWTGTDKAKTMELYYYGTLVATIEYYSDGVNVSKETRPDGAVYEIYQSGNLKSSTNLLGYREYLDESFYGPSEFGYPMGRISRQILGGVEYRYTEYWPGTDKIKTKEIYQNGVLQKTQRFASDGTTLISETSPSGIETRFIEYWPGTTTLKKVELYQAGVFQKALEYFSDGIQISKETLPNGNVTGYYLSGRTQSFLDSSAGTLTEYRDEDYYSVGTTDPTTIEDGSSAGHSLTIAGNAQIDLTNKRAASTNSMPIRLDGSGDYVQVNDSPDWDFGTGDFTWETWIQFSSTTGDIELFSRSDAEWSLQKTLSGNLRLQLNDRVVKSEAWSPVAGTWYHVAVERSSGNLYFYVNGNVLGTGTADSTNIIGSNPIQVGATHTGARSLNGWVDGFRVSKGVARYTGNFTPPADLVADGQSNLSLAPVLVPAGPSQGRKTRELLSDGSENRYVEYWSDTDTVKTKEIYQNSVLLKTESYAIGGAILATTYYVYAGDSIQAMIDRAVAGDTIVVGSGTYHEHLILKEGVSLKGQDAKTTIITGDSAVQTHVIVARGNNTIENLTVTGGGAYSGSASSAIRVEGNEVVIRGNRITDNQDYGVQVWFTSDHVTIEHNLFLNNKEIGIQLPQNQTTIQNNTLVHNGIGINILGGAAPTIDNNVITDSTFQAIYEYAVAQNPTDGYAHVSNNTFFNNAEKGGYYSKGVPPAVANQTDGNQIADPHFVDPTHGDYSQQSVSSAAATSAVVLSAELSSYFDVKSQQAEERNSPLYGTLSRNIQQIQPSATSANER